MEKRKGMKGKRCRGDGVMMQMKEGNIGKDREGSGGVRGRKDKGWRWLRNKNS
jgi:hypothetical protein